MLDLSSLPPLKQIIADYGLDAKKSLGQHFLLDRNITDRIAKYAGDLRDHTVIEIGPGPGGLTRSLLQAGAKKLYVIEMDERCVAALAPVKAVAGEQLQIIQGDGLHIDLMNLPGPRKIIANLPYNVGTQMLIEWLGNIAQHGNKAFSSLTLMFQKEVAERIVASPGSKDFGRISVLAQWLCECRTEFELPPGAFSPPPKVSSTVITLTPREKPLMDVDQATLEKVVAKAFGQRRKMLRSALKGLPVNAEILLKEAEIDGTLRAEQLQVIDFCRLALSLNRHS